jgi:hypothetical protein
MPRQTGGWVRVKALTAQEKADIAARCEQLIEQFLKPRFQVSFRPTHYNYPVDIFGKWRSNKYSFITRYRSGFEHNLGKEFDSGFTRLDHLDECMTETRFDVMWHRHTGQWWRLHTSVTLDEALHLIETKGILHPPL